MHFDARHAKALKPGEAYAIPGCPGLRLEATQTLKTWTYRYRHPVSDKLKQKRLGTWPQMPPAGAVAEWSRLRALRDSGVDPAEDGVVPSSEVDPEFSLGKMVELYHERHLKPNRQPRGAKAHYQRLQRVISGHEATPVTRIGRVFAHELIAKFSSTPVAAKAARVDLIAAWEYGTNAGKISEDLPNPFQKIRVDGLKSKGAKRDGAHKGTAKRVLRPLEVRTLFSSQMHLFSPQVRDVLTLYAWTATRGGEICQMHRDHLAVEGGVLWWTIPKALSKLRNHETASDLRVPLIGRAREIVDRLLDEHSGWLFPSQARDGTVTYVKQAYIQSKVHYRQPYSRSRPDHVRERLTVSHWSPHDLRRTSRTMLAGMGCPEEVAEAIIGHVKPGVVGVYNLYRYDAERVHWLRQLDAKLEAIISGTDPSVSELLCSPEAGSSTPAS